MKNKESELIWRSDMYKTQTIGDITLEQIMGEDCHIWISKNKRFGFDLEIEGTDFVNVKDTEIHPFAMESMADFCKRFLRVYDKVVTGKQQEFNPLLKAV